LVLLKLQLQLRLQASLPTKSIPPPTTLICKIRMRFTLLVLLVFKEATCKLTTESKEMLEVVASVFIILATKSLEAHNQ